MNLVATPPPRLIWKTAAGRESRRILDWNSGVIGEFWEKQIREVVNQEFLNCQNWVLAEANYQGRLRDWFRASCHFIRESGRVRFDATLQEQEDGRGL